MACDHLQYGGLLYAIQIFKMTTSNVYQIWNIHITKDSDKKNEIGLHHYYQQLSVRLSMQTLW